MSKLKQLIDKLCPNGVEYKEINTVIKSLKTGLNPRKNFRLNTSDAKNYYVTVRELNGKDIKITEKTDRVNDEALKLINNRSNLEVNDVLFSGTGTIGRTALVDKKPINWNVKEGVYVIKPDLSKISSMYLIYVLNSSLLKQIYMNKAMGSTVESISMNDFKKIKIPVPPLEVQNEIVRLLDRLTVATESIKGELSKEIVSQKKQYQYYRDLLLNFDNDINISDKSSAKRLIKELCPNGVEFTEIGEICKLVAGGDVPKDSYSEIKTEEYSVPIYSNGIGEKAVYGYTKIAKINEPCVTIAARGTIGYSAIRKEPFYPIIRLICAIPNDKITVSFLYYYLTTVKFHVPITGIPQLTIPMVKKYKVPLPPLEVQNKIVEILDRFNTLANDITCGLPAEIELQQKRYEYFRDLLLTFDDSLNDNAQVLKCSSAQVLKCSSAQVLKCSRARIVFWLRFGDTCTLKAGKSISANNISSEFDEENRYPCYGANGIRGYVSNFNEETTASIIGRQGALCGSVHYAEGKYYATEHAVVVKSKGFYLPRFLYYLLTVANLSQYKTAGAQPGLSVSKLENIMLPIPSLEEQQRIVNILDRFDKLCNDITCGLPAEIELHQKRYEYYRDKLLSFRELQTK